VRGGFIAETEGFERRGVAPRPEEQASSEPLFIQQIKSTNTIVNENENSQTERQSSAFGWGMRVRRRRE